MELIYRVALLLAVFGVSSQDKLSSGGCLEDGELVPEGSLVPQQDPCHVCHCHRGRIECFWKSCAPPPRLCEVMQLEDRCNPSLYVCPIPASVADAPLRSSSSLLTETRQPVPESPRPAVSAPARGRGRSRSRFSSSRLAASSRLRSPNSAAAPVTAAKPARLSSRRRRPTVRASQSQRTVTRTQVRTPQAVTRTEVKPPQPVTRSRSRSRRPTQRQVQPRPGMKIRLGPPVLPLVRPVDSFLPPPADNSVVADSAVAASVLSGSTYFNEELSVPQNFTMPQGRGEATLRSPQELLLAAEERKPFRFGPSRSQVSRAPSSEVAEASEVQPVTEAPLTTTTTAAPTDAPTAASTPARGTAGTGRGFRRTGRRRDSRRRLVSSATPTRPRVSSRQPASPPRTPSARRSRPASRRQQTAVSRASETTATPPVSTAAATVEPASTAAPAAPAAPAAQKKSSRRAHSRARGRSDHAAVPLMTFDYDLEEEDINPSDFMFPEFGRRLRRSLPSDEVFDAAAVRRLEAEWSARQRRRRRSLLPGDDNHVHDHGHEHAKSCSILGVKYELGEVIGVASDNCLECRCAAQAMFCSPKCCFFALEERVLREGRRRSPDQEPPRPHPLHAYIVE